jgi:hypothetical protein
VAIDASSLLGSRQIAGVRVTNVRGQWGSRRVIDRLLSPLAAVMLGRTPPIPAQTPKFRAGYLAVTDSELALVQLAAGATLKPVDVVSRIPRSNVVSAQVGKGLSPQLTVRFADGEAWQFEIPNPGILAIVPSGNWRRHGRRVAEVLRRGAVARP